AGIEFDLGHALAVRRALEPCQWAEVNAALMLHDGGASKAEVQAYLERWALMTPEWTAHMIRFFTEPTSRSYILTYAAGGELCRSYVAGDPLPPPPHRAGARPRPARGTERRRAGIEKPR
ncbi:MAG: hypothetical protein ACRDNP_00800, partial [Gaiellaceae bacterium]